MKNLLLALFTLLSSCVSSQAVFTNNRQFELGVSAGPLIFLGDLQGNRGIGMPFLKDANLPNTKLMYGAFVSYYPNFYTSPFALKFTANFGRVVAADSLIVNTGGGAIFRKRRNLSFRSRIQDAYVSLEYYVLKGNFRPYLSAGIGFLHFDPQAELNGTWYDLRRFKLEGVAYASTGVMFPLGFGFKHYHNNGNILTVEVMYRRTNTDFIDDVSTVYQAPSQFSNYLSPTDAEIARALAFREKSSRTDYAGEQRGDSSDDDAYFTITFKYSFMADNTVGFLQKQSTRCPIFY